MAVTALVLAFVLAGAVVAAFALYLAGLALAAFRHPGPAAPAAAPSRRIAVLVPAHDEEGLIGRCVRSLRAQDYPTDRFEVVVVADNCTDATATAAREAGARVLVRDVPDVRGKGQALRWAMARLLAEPEFDAIAVVDADSEADPAFLSTLAAPLEAGALAVQGESLLLEDGSPRTALRAAAFLLINRVRPSGRAVLGRPCNLCGNGMLLTRELLAAHPWDAFTAAEDLEYAVSLRSAGIGPVFARGAILRSAAAPDAAAAAQQQLRWEGGKVHLARHHVPRLIARGLRERRPGLLELAFELALPPLGLLAAAAAGGTVVGLGLVAFAGLPVWAVVSWALALLAIPVFVLTGLRAGGAPASAYRALARAPLFVASKALGAHRLLRFRADTWVRTAREPRTTDS